MYRKILSRILTVVIILSSTYLFAQEEPTEPTRPPMGLRVQPGGLLVQYVPLGTTYDFSENVGIPLTIYNRDVSPHTYLLSTDKPSTVAARKWLKGYLEIPDPSWFWFEKDEVKVEPNSKAEVKMYLNIPDEEKYYNQHWTVALGVKGKPEPGQMLALAVYPRIQIETLSRDGIKERPDGIIGFTPSILSFEDLALGKKEKLKVRIYNNDNRRHTYQIGSNVFPTNPKKEFMHTLPTYAWIPNPTWIKPGRSCISIKPHESEELTIEIKIPKQKEHYNRNWEAILFVEAKKTLPGFVRIQIKTEPMEKHEE